MCEDYKNYLILLIRIGKLSSGGKQIYLYGRSSGRTLRKGEHVMFVVTVECIDDYITAGKSLNRKVYINEEK